MLLSLREALIYSRLLMLASDLPWNVWHQSSYVFVVTEVMIAPGNPVKATVVVVVSDVVVPVKGTWTIETTVERLVVINVDVDSSRKTSVIPLSHMDRWSHDW